MFILKTAGRSAKVLYDINDSTYKMEVGDHVEKDNIFTACFIFGTYSRRLRWRAGQVAPGGEGKIILKLASMTAMDHTYNQGAARFIQSLGKDEVDAIINTK
jgi:hypothetical protein